MTSKIPVKYRNLVLSGGGVKGICHIGAVKKLMEKKLLDMKELDTVVCSSAGALFGFMLVVGFDIDEIWDFMVSIDMKKLLRPDLGLLLSRYAIDSGDTLFKTVDEILNNKTGKNSINFAELYEITHIHLIIVGSCLTTKTAVYFDHINTPTMSVSRAIRISISIPGVFSPVVIDGLTYIDGGILDSYPIHKLDDKINETIGILILDDCDTEYSCPEQFFSAIFNLTVRTLYSRAYLPYINNTIYINESHDVSLFDFSIDNTVKTSLYRLGYRAAEDFLLASDI